MPPGLPTRIMIRINSPQEARDAWREIKQVERREMLINKYKNFLLRSGGEKIKKATSHNRLNRLISCQRGDRCDFVLHFGCGLSDAQ